MQISFQLPSFITRFVTRPGKLWLVTTSCCLEHIESCFQQVSPAPSWAQRKKKKSNKQIHLKVSLELYAHLHKVVGKLFHLKNHDMKMAFLYCSAHPFHLQNIFKVNILIGSDTVHSGNSLLRVLGFSFPEDLSKMECTIP